MPLNALLAEEPLLLEALKAGVVVLGYFVTAALCRFAVVRIGRGREHEPARIRGALQTCRLVLRLLFVFILMIVLGVDLAAIPAFLGSFLAVVGVACFASWSILSNITSGLIIYAAKDLQIGDTVRIHDDKEPFEGVITEFRLWSLVLKLKNGGQALIPNSVIVQRPIVIVARARTGRTTELLAQHDG